MKDIDSRFLRMRIVFIFSIWAMPAYAYVDPGSGLLLIQGLLAFLGGLLVFIKNPIKTIKHFFDKFKKR